MSFSLEFNARDRKTARSIVKSTPLPLPVQTFLLEGLRALDVDQGVYVKAQGHLCDDDCTRSSPEIIVQPIVYWDWRET